MLEKRRVRVLQDGQPIATYESLADCARLRNWNVKTVHMALKRGHKIHGYGIEYYDDPQTKYVKAVFMRKPFT